MKLWLWYVPGSEADIEDACRHAEGELARRGLTVDAAYEAVIAANEVDDVTTTYNAMNANAIAAWYTAEQLAFDRLYHLVGEWPHQGALIAIE
jgi:hypothetical protein